MVTSDSGEPGVEIGGLAVGVVGAGLYRVLCNGNTQRRQARSEGIPLAGREGGYGSGELCARRARQPQSPTIMAPGVYQRLCWAAMGSPAHSFIASRLSRAGYFAAAGPSAKATSRFVVTCRVRAPVFGVMP